MRYLQNKVILLILLFYLIISIYLRINNISVYTNIINPIFWVFILMYLMCNIKKYHIRFNINKKYNIYMFIFTCINIIFYVYTGIFLGFTKSPYSHQITKIIENIIIQIIPIIGVEVARYVIINGNKNNKFVIGTSTILLILIEINYGVLVDLFFNKEELFEYICSNIITLISCSILCTYLTQKGTCTLSLIYRVLNSVIIIILPILPDINWFEQGAIYIISPTIIYLLFKYVIIQQNENDIKDKYKNIYEKIVYAIVLLLAITLVCFMIGVFKYEPIALLSNSMVPTYSRGDVVIYKKINEEELKEINENSIIVYSLEGQNVAHRVVDVAKDKEKVLYQTKGDNNNAPDSRWVEVDQIKGLYSFHIKYIGLPSVWLYEYFNNENAKVETK